MDINLVWNASVDNAPTGFKTAMEYAATALDKIITNDFTANISVGWGEIGGTDGSAGTPFGANILAEGGPVGGSSMTYDALVQQLGSVASNAADRSAVAALPKIAPPGVPQNLYITQSQMKAWGIMMDAHSTGLDGQIGFGSTYSYTFDPNNRAVPAEFDAIGAAEHEMTHALGRLKGDGAFDLTDYEKPGQLGHGYYSTDGGVIDRADYALFGDLADLRDGPDSFNYVTSPGVENDVTALDQTMIGTLGFHLASDGLVASHHPNHGHPHKMNFATHDHKCHLHTA